MTIAKKAVAVSLVSIMVLLLLTCTVNPVYGQTLQPIGTIAVEIIGVPEGTPSGTQLGWVFNSFEHNATLTEPYCVVSLNQSLSADANNTLQAEPNPTVSLSRIYALDYNPYIVNAFNDSTTFKASGTFNLTLGNHYILNETWVKSITIKVYANTSISMNTLARWYIYNFTDDSWITLGDLNSVTRASLNSTISSGITTIIDENANNILMIKYNYTDTTNTDFTLHIDYLEVVVEYDLRFEIDNWSISNTYSGDLYIHIETFSISSPSGVVGHNVTVWLVSPSRFLVVSGSESVLVDGKIPSSITRFSDTSNLGFKITNIVSNSTRIQFNIPHVYILSVINGTVTAASFANRRLQIVVNAPAGTVSETLVYAGDYGVPRTLYINGRAVSPTTRSIYNQLSGDCWYYDSENKIIYIKASHSSAVQIVVDWSVPTEAPPPTTVPPEQIEPVARMFVLQLSLILASLTAILVLVLVPVETKIRVMLAVVVFFAVLLSLNLIFLLFF